MHKLEDVFGVRTKPVLSYVQRPSVDDEFVNALRGDKQIIVYGLSRQGKTALVQQHLPSANNLRVSLSPGMSATDIYASVARQLGIWTEDTSSTQTSSDTGLGGKGEFTAGPPFFKIGASADSSHSSGRQHTITFKGVPYNLEQAQSVAELLQRYRLERFILLENFHYLDDRRQEQLAFDLRTFQELGIRFVILGVWREKNRLTMFNGDLADRIVEIPVEPWHDKDFERVAKKGQAFLNVEFTEQLLRDCTQESFGSIGIFQELLCGVCLAAGVTQTVSQLRPRPLTRDLLAEAINSKAATYAGRHQRALAAIADGNANSTQSKERNRSMCLAYCLIRVLLQEGYDGIKNGMSGTHIRQKIREFHPRPDKVTAASVTRLLHTLAPLQEAKGIKPPIIDYDQSVHLLQAIDSTFFFFLKNADPNAILEEIADPFETARKPKAPPSDPSILLLPRDRISFSGLDSERARITGRKRLSSFRRLDSIQLDVDDWYFLPGPLATSEDMPEEQDDPREQDDTAPER
jgi:hypothetical protein